MFIDNVMIFDLSVAFYCAVWRSLKKCQAIFSSQNMVHKIWERSYTDRKKLKEMLRKMLNV